MNKKTRTNVVKNNDDFNNRNGSNLSCRLSVDMNS